MFLSLSRGLAAVACALSVAAPVQAQQPLTWVYHSEVAASPFDSILVASFGEPETDHVLLFGECVFGDAGPLVKMSFVADTGHYGPGQVVEFALQGHGGSPIRVPGTVFQYDIIGGVEVVVEPLGAFTRLIAGPPQITFGIPGRPLLTLSIVENQSAVRQFLHDCANIGALSAALAPAPVVPQTIPQQVIDRDPSSFGCESLSSMRSNGSGQVQNLTFVNRTNAFRGLLWLDGEGQPLSMAGLNAGEQVTFTTEPGHFWVITDGPGNCVELAGVAPGIPEFLITVPD